MPQLTSTSRLFAPVPVVQIQRRCRSNEGPSSNENRPFLKASPKTHGAFRDYTVAKLHVKVQN